MSASFSFCAYRIPSFHFHLVKIKGRHILAGWGGLHFSGRRSDKKFGCVYLDKSTGRVKRFLCFTMHEDLSKITSLHDTNLALALRDGPSVCSLPIMACATMEFRADKNRDIWHFCNSCSGWPIKPLDVIRLDRLPTELKLCPECQALSLKLISPESRSPRQTKPLMPRS